MSHTYNWKNLSKEELVTAKPSVQIKYRDNLPFKPYGQIEISPVAGARAKSMNGGRGFQWQDWVDCWHSGEWLWQGTIKKSFIQFDPLVDSITDTHNYLQLCKYNQKVPEGYEWDINGDMDMENFIKMVWLSKEFFEGGWQFRNRLCCHYNPKLQKIQIHPGGSRNKVVDLFGGDDVPVIFFNTGGFYHEEMMENLEPMDLEQFATDTEWSGTCVADHGSLIPHLMKDVHSIGNHKEIWHEKLSERAQTLKIFTNVDRQMISWWKSIPEENPVGFDNASADLLRDKWLTNNVLEANVNVTFKYIPHETHESGRPWYRDQIKAMVCAFAGINWEDKWLLVRCH